MRPLFEWPAEDRRGLIGLFTDIDDTLTTEGAVPPDVVAALGALKAAGLHVVPITGRPVGWSEPFAAAWPVDAIVPENGAMALVPQADGSLHRLYQQDAATRTANYARMQQVLAQIERDIPGARRATDSAGRECDIAVDHSEFTQLSESQIDQVVQAMRHAGMHATV
ncbi:MAG: HAD family hydrolase, partial [Comamonadaceae bacterium]